MPRLLLIVVLLSLLLSLPPGCRQQPAGELPPAVLGAGELPQGPNQYRFSAEAGFSADLSNPPQFVPQVKPYEIEAGLRNVANLRQFRDDLRPEHLRMIEQNGFVVVPADWKQMEFIYELNNYETEHVPSFVTVDSLLHCFHIFYDYLLRTIEATTLYDRLTTFAVGLLQGAARQYHEADLPELREAALRNWAFCLVPVRLLGVPETQWGESPPAEVKRLADRELAHIEAHEGMEVSPTAGFKVDYSQFIPRGHYTRSEKLERYFRAMMWYGLVPLTFRNMRDELAPRSARQAALLAQVLLYGEVDGEPLGKVWEDLYEPTAFLVGFADDNTPADFGRALYQHFGEPVAAPQLIPEDNLAGLAQTLLSLRPPGIPMASVTRDPELPGIPQFRVMGQRFVLDSYLFQMMVFPHVGTGQDEGPLDQPGTFNKRTFPMGLDVMSLLGSQRAYEIADEVYEQTRFKNYAEQTEKLRAEIAAYTDADWSRNIYVGWLHTLKLLLEPAGEGYPSFMLGQAWTDKTLNAALGSWAELRHDTVLYAKQSVVAQCGGGPDEEPPPSPRGYVEPVPHVYWRLGLLTTQLRDGLAARGLLADEQLQESFNELISLIKFLQDVSLKQLTNQRLTQEEFDQIEYYGATLARLNLYTKQGDVADEITSMTDKDMAVISDVHTGTMGGPLYALQEGVGHAHEVYVVYPMDGRLLLGRGAVFSYYEFLQPVEDRLTDEKWQQMLESARPPESPPWTASFLSKLKGTGESVEFQSVPEFTGGGC